MLSLTLTSPDDLLAAVPVILGFHPTDSCVMLTFGGRNAFHARIDMLRPAERFVTDFDEYADRLLAPVHDQEPGAVFLVYYTDDSRAAALLHQGLVERCAALRVEVHGGLRVAHGRWFRADGSGSHGGEAGTPFEVEQHPFYLRAVVEGWVTESSRAAVAAGFANDPAGTQRVADLLAIPSTAAPSRRPGAVVAAAVARGGVLTDAEAVLVIRAAQQSEPAALAELWGQRSGRSAQQHAAVWADLVRRTPEAFLAEVAGVAAAFCWLAGDGAKAWCALDVADGARAGQELALLDVVAGLLEAGVPPAAPQLNRRLIEHRCLNQPLGGEAQA